MNNNVYYKTVAYDLCIGCGVCAGVCPNRCLVMMPTETGSYCPHLASEEKCASTCSICVEACPFGEHGEDEDSLGRSLFDEIPGIKHRVETGYFLETYVGYVSDPEYRWKRSSGGMATWFLRQLLEKNVVDHVICVVSQSIPHRLFEFAILSKPQDLVNASKSAYYPVELSECLLKVLEDKTSRYAVIALPCFIKALRLASLKLKWVRERILIYAGLTCGQLKSKGFTEILIRSAGLNLERVQHISFREKAVDRPASNFSIAVFEGGRIITLEWLNFPSKIWMSPMFTPRPCNFCDDIFAELADVTFMDAWLPEYISDPAGTNLVIIRSEKARGIIEEGIASGECFLSEIPVERVIEAQQGVIDRKRKVLSRRLWIEARKGNHVPRKRVNPVKPSLLERLYLENEEEIRKQSFIALKAQRESGEDGVGIFMDIMKPLLNRRKWLYRLKPENMKAGILRRMKRVFKFVSRYLG